MPRSRRWWSSAARRACASGSTIRCLHHRVKDFHTQSDVFRRLCVRRRRAERSARPPSARSTACWTAVVRYRGRATSRLPRDMVGVVPDGAAHAHRTRSRRAIRTSLAEAVAEAVAADRRRPAAGDHRRRGDPSLRPAGRSCWPWPRGRAFRSPTTMLGKSVDQRAASAVRRHLRRGDGPRGGHAVRRGERLRDPAGRVHDRHQPGHLHGQSRPGPLHLRHQRNAADQPSPLSTTCCWPISSTGWPRAGLEGPAADAAAASRRAPTSRSNSGPNEPITIRRLIARLNQSLDDDDGGDRRPRRRAVRLQRPGDPPADRVPQPGLLHVDGFCRAGGAGRDGRPARPAAGRAGGRRRVPDDRHGALDASSATASTRSSSCWTTRATAPSGCCTPGDHKFNDIQPWHYHKLPEVLGGGTGYEVRTEGEFDARPRAGPGRPLGLQPDPGPSWSAGCQPCPGAAGTKRLRAKV